MKLAADEVDEAVAWYNSRQAGVGEEFADAAANTIRRMQRQPLGWQKVGTRLRRVRLVRFPYAPLPGELVIVAVMHDRRKPNYWRARLQQLP